MLPNGIGDFSAVGLVAVQRPPGLFGGSDRLGGFALAFKLSEANGVGGYGASVAF